MILSKLYFILAWGFLTALGLCVLSEILEWGLHVPLSFKIADRAEMFLTIMVPLIAMWLFRFVLGTDFSTLHLLALAIVILLLLRFWIFSAANERLFGYKFPEIMPRVQ